MKGYRPLLLQPLQLKLPGLVIHRVSLNQHFPEKNWMHLHHHSFSQFLLYLTGSGTQSIEGHRHAVRAGALLMVPPGKEHSFHRLGSQRPLCLVIDFNLRLARARSGRLAQLAYVDLVPVRQSLSGLMKIHGLEAELTRVRVASIVLGLFDQLLRGIGLLPPPSERESSPIVTRLERLLNQPEGIRLTTRQIAGKAGYQQDYLNRRLKQEVGLTLGQFLARHKVATAKGLLQSQILIQDAAEALGFADQNYFARWFRQQTGNTPTQWRRVDSESNAKNLPQSKQCLLAERRGQQL